MSQCRNLVYNQHELSIRRQSELLCVHRSGLYYAPKDESQENLKIMRIMDEHYLEHPSEGVIRIQICCCTGLLGESQACPQATKADGVDGDISNEEPKQIGFEEIYSSLLVEGPRHKPAKSGLGNRHQFSSNEERILVYNGNYRCIQPLYCRLGISNTLEADASLWVLKQAINDHSKPEIVNSDQGSQFTCEDWVSYLKEEDIRISMDGKGRAIDNIFIERFWRSLKWDYVYLHPANDGVELFQGVKKHIHYYNILLHHQGIDRRIPATLYKSAA